MIYYVILLLILIYVALHKKINISRKNKKKFLLFSFGLLSFVAILRSTQVGIDLNYYYSNYYVLISQLAPRDFQAFSISSGYEMGFICFCKLLSVVSSNPQWLVFVTSIIIYSVLARFIYRYSSDVVFSTFLVVLSCYYYMSMNIIRQMLAICIVLLAFDMLASEKNKCKRYICFTLLVLLATTFHQSAIICLVFILFDIFEFKRAYIIVAMVFTLGMLLFYDKVYSIALFFMGNAERYIAHITSATEGVGGISINASVNIILTFGAFIYGYFSLIVRNKRHRVIKLNGVKETERTKNLFLYLCLMAGVFRLLAVRMNILNRVTFYFLPFVFILYPLAVYNGGRYRKIMKAGIYCGYFVYFTYMTFNLAQEYYGTIPYYFFWQ